MAMVRKLALTITMIALLGSPLPVLAQTTGPNGGMLAGKSDHQTELLVSTTELTVYLLDGGKPHDTKGVSIKGVVQQAGKNTNIAFTGQGGNRFVAKLPTPLEKGAIVVLTGRDDHGDSISARYAIN
jgi:hypothetical protein